MDILNRIAPKKRNRGRGAWSLAIGAGLLLATAAAFADDPTTMAPPVQLSAPQETGGDASANSVFNWQEIPANQQVPLTRAAFDQGGYQLYDRAGETIVVPFTNQNLYVMKFAPSDTGSMYFVNEGNYPVLYVPKDGYLENATVAGARWFPFGHEFHPSEPVFLGIAPSWSAFVGMGWYPDMFCYGGYWSHEPYFVGGVFLPTVGLFFEIGGHPYYGWDSYHHYGWDHPAPYHIAYYDRGFYNRGFDRGEGRLIGPERPFFGAGHAFYAHRSFQGAGGYYTHQNFGGAHSFSSGRTFRGASGSWSGAHTYSSGHEYGSGHEYSNGGGSFRGASGSWQGSHNDSSGREYSSGRSSQGASGSWQGGHSAGGRSGSGGGGNRGGGGGNHFRG